MHSAARVFEMVQGGHLIVNIDQHRPLAEIVAAHRDLEAAATTGSTILMP